MNRNILLPIAIMCLSSFSMGWGVGRIVLKIELQKVVKILEEPETAPCKDLKGHEFEHSKGYCINHRVERALRLLSE